METKIPVLKEAQKRIVNLSAKNRAGDDLSFLELLIYNEMCVYLPIHRGREREKGEEKDGCVLFSPPQNPLCLITRKGAPVLGDIFRIFYM